jgi:murein DD-endopeptidase MepM/ murein hydrolase activator NlpD
MPVEGRIISAFGYRSDPLSAQEKFHSGIDIAARAGQEIYPTKKGRVIFSGLTEGYGNTVVIDHQDGFLSKYAHNWINLVSVGEEAGPEQVIALVGSTGRSFGPHLHFEIHYQGEKIDPLQVVSREEGPAV